MIPVAGDVVLDDAHRSFTLAKLVKSGGAGAVFLLKEAPHLVAKIYHRDVDRATYARKLDAMLRLSPDLPDIIDGGHRRVQIAWPTSRLRDRYARFVGFLMPAVDVDATSELEMILQDKQARAARLPTGLGAKATLAANLSAVVAALHAQRHYIVDLKPVNLRFHRDSLHMAMLDCDGFSIQGAGERFPAPQFTPDYLAPEFQRNGITPEGEQAQDRFALAVVIFQLLNFGIHPFTGRPISNAVPTDIPGRIAGRWYPYGTRANAGMAPNPGSGHLRMPTDVRAMFDRAFQSQGLARPSAGEWQELLASYARRSTQRLVACARDATHQHYVGLACAHCERTQLLQQARAVQPVRAATQGNARRTIGIARAHRAARTAKPAPMRLPAYVPTQPPYQPPTLMQRLWRRLVQRALGVLIWLAILSIAGLFKNMMSSPESTVARPRVEIERQVHSEPRPSVASMAPPAADEYVPPLDVLVGSTRWIEADVANAGDYRDDLSQRVGRLRARARLPASAETLDAFHTAMVKDAQALTDEASERKALNRTLEGLLRHDPYAGEIAFELGHMALAEGDITTASRHFTHAIAVAPADPAGWYGFAATTLRIEEQYGALSIAELLADDAAKAQLLRGRFPPELLMLTGIDPDRFAVVSARARVRAARLGGMPVPSEVEVLAAGRLP